MAQDKSKTRIELNLRTDEVREKASQANAAILEALALQIQGQAQANIVANNQVDTGFMLNSVYAVTAQGSGYSDARAKAEARNLWADMAPEADLGDADAAVVVGAEYAIHQEERKPFLYPAAEQVANQAGATIQKIGGEVLNE